MHFSSIFTFGTLLSNAVVTSSPVPNNDTIFLSTKNSSPTTAWNDTILPPTYLPAREQADGGNSTIEPRSVEYCKSWFMWRDKWYEGNIYQRFRYILGTNAPEFRRRYIGDYRWRRKFEHVPWLWTHRMDNGRLHRHTGQCGGSLAHNMMIYFHEEWKTWVFDVDEVAGPVGRMFDHCMYSHMIWNWEHYTGCSNSEVIPSGFVADG